LLHTDHDLVIYNFEITFGLPYEIIMSTMRFRFTQDISYSLNYIKDSTCTVIVKEH
jgi:hypothetical protein